jgi:hypothetical protein
MRAPLFAFAIAALARTSIAQVHPLENAPSVLHLSSGQDVNVLEVFKSGFLETDEPVLVLRYQTSQTMEDPCSESQALEAEVKQVWEAFKPIVEKERFQAATISTMTASGRGLTRVWKKNVSGPWRAVRNEDGAQKIDGLYGFDIYADTHRASAIVHLRITFNPTVHDPQDPNVEEQIVQSVSVVRVLKKAPDFLGEAALREAQSTWRVGEKWPSSDWRNYVDYLVMVELPLGDYDGGGTSERSHMIPVTDGVLRNVERALQSNPQVETTNQ